MKNAIHTLLIANRGEIANRIIRTCRKMGIRTVAVYSDADRDAPFVQAADRAFRLGPAPAADSYLRGDRIINLAKQAGADAIHPGYGFLSENPDFARAVEAAGLIWIGPHPEAIDQMGSKSTAKALMETHAVPTIPGYRGEDQSPETMRTEARKIGFPVLLKASAGGGGKGMRIVHGEEELADALAAAKAESQKAFGSEEILLEKYFARASHVEFQILGDRHGNLLHLYERECSIQRRHQKIIEETPAPQLRPDTRQAMADAALRAAKALKYDNAGTVEFLFTPEQHFYFLEVNTRLQVEHPVTELTTGLDLVEWQIRIAAGEALSLHQEDIQPEGHAIECRLYAENPSANFLPETGTLLRWDPADLPGLRYDSGVESGSVVETWYDPLLAKIIAYGRDRPEALRRMHYALGQLACVGVQTNQNYLQSILQHEVFNAGKPYTHFISDHQSELLTMVRREEDLSQAGIAACLFLSAQRRQQQSHFRSVPSGWRNNFYAATQQTFRAGDREIRLRYRIEGAQWIFWMEDQEEECRLTSLNSKGETVKYEWNGQIFTFRVFQDGEDLFIFQPGAGTAHLQKVDRLPLPGKSRSEGSYEAPMPGEVIAIAVEAGSQVKAGQTLLTLYSMKMEMQVTAFRDGTVADIPVQVGQQVKKGDLLIDMHAEENT